MLRAARALKLRVQHMVRFTGSRVLKITLAGYGVLHENHWRDLRGRSSSRQPHQGDSADRKVLRKDP